jgi:IclR family transcriptional regulator, KDG regulon repressor
MRDPNHVRVVVKTLRLIEALAQSKTSVRLGELAVILGQPKTSVFRVLATLKQQGYVQQAPGTDAYQLTDRVALWSRNKLDDSLRQTARPYLGRLLARFEQTVNLAMFDAGQIRYVEILEGLRSIRAAPNEHAVAPLHCTALGKAVLAFLPPAEARERLEASAPLQKYTSHTITSLRVLSKELIRIRKQGYALDNEETEEGARCVAAPLFGPKEKPIAGISITGPLSSLRGNTIQEVAQALKQCTRGISTQLGYLP